MSVNDLIDEYYNMRSDHDQLKAETAAAYKGMQRAEAKLVDAMLDEGVNSVGRDSDGTHISLRKRFTISVTVENEQQIRDWLTEEVGDDTDFVVEKLNKTAVTDLVKQKVEVDLEPETEIPEFLKLNTSPTVSVRGWKERMKG